MTDWPDSNKPGVPINSNNTPMLKSEQESFTKDCKYIGPCLTPNQIADLVHDQIVGMYHPEFGTEWREPDGSLYLLFKRAHEYSKKQGRKQGLQEAEQAIRLLIDKR